MMMKIQAWLFFPILILHLSACAKNEERRQDPAGPIVPEKVEKTSLVAKKIRTILDRGDGSCSAGGKFEGCRTQVVRLNSPVPPTGSGQRVLILDSFFVPPSAFGRYQKRILGFHHLADSETGQYQEWSPSAKVPLLLRKALAEIDDKTEISDLESVAKDLNRLHFQIEILNHPKNPAIGHVNPIFNWLAEWNPKAEFALVEFPVPSDEIICALDEVEGRRDFAQFFKTAGEELADIIKRNNIDYVNLSFTPTEDSLAEHYSRQCQKDFDQISERDRTMLQLHRAQILGMMTKANPDLVIVQAVPNQAKSKLEKNDSGAPFICNQNKQTVTIGFFTDLNSDVGPAGIPIQSAWMHPSQRNGVNCTDAFINGGMVESRDPQATKPDQYDEHSLYQNYNGVLLNPEPLMATSWATPLALSMIMHWKAQALEQGAPVTPLALKEKIKGRMWDPLRNKTLNHPF